MINWRGLGLDFVTLRVFKAAVEEKSFAAAAEREHLAASAISRRIAELESRLGVSLLRRHDRGVEATPAGELLMRHVESLFGVVDATLRDLDSLTRGNTGVVRINASLSMISTILPRILGRVKAEHPNIELRLIQQNSEVTVLNLLQGVPEIGFVSGIEVPDNLQKFEFLTDPLRVIVSKNSPLKGKANGLSLSDISDFDYIGLRDDLALQKLVNRNAIGQNIALRTTVITDGFDSITKFVEEGLGVSIVPAAHAHYAEKLFDIRALPLLEDWAVRQTYLCVKSVSDLSPAAGLVLKSMLRNQTNLKEWTHGHE